MYPVMWLSGEHETSEWVLTYVFFEVKILRNHSAANSPLEKVILSEHVIQSELGMLNHFQCL